jgi:hypothetical protein
MHLLPLARCSASPGSPGEPMGSKHWPEVCKEQSGKQEHTGGPKNVKGAGFRRQAYRAWTDRGLVNSVYYNFM